MRTTRIILAAVLLAVAAPTNGLANGRYILRGSAPDLPKPAKADAREVESRSSSFDGLPTSGRGFILQGGVPIKPATNIVEPTQKQESKTPEELEKQNAEFAKKITACLRLTGLAVNSGQRLAQINNRTLGKLDERVFDVDGQPVKVRCVDILDDAVVLRANGLPGNVTLRLSSKP